MQPTWKSILAGAALLALAALGAGAATVNPLFDSNMVLQRGIPIPVYGTGSPGESVQVELKGPAANASAAVTVDADGGWIAYLAAQEASAQPHTLTVNGKVFSNVLIGDVWICAGQSNMEGEMEDDPAFNRSSVDGLNIRLMRLRIWYDDEKWKSEKLNASEPDYGPQATRDIFLRWTVAVGSERNTQKFSTAGLVLAREIAKATGVPVGLIQNAMGGTAIEAWTPREYFNTPFGEKIRQDYYTLRAGWSGTQKDGKPQDEPAILYNSLMHPLTRYGVKGMYWWQGEHNTSSWNYDLKKASNYRRVLPVFIQAMRDKFVHRAAGDMPVLIQQLHPYGSTTKLGESNTAHVRAGQYEAVRNLNNLGIGVGHDIPAGGGDTQIHPTNREAYAMRSAAAALGLWYGHGTTWQPSGWTGCVFSGGEALIIFTPGLTLSTRDGQPPSEFVVMDGSGKFHNASATMAGDNQVRVTAPSGVEIREIRFAFSDLPKSNLVNSNGLPVSTFRIERGSAGLYADWASEAGLNGAGADPLADPDGDRVSNLESYAYGLLPGGGGQDIGGRQRLPALDLAGGQVDPRLAFLLPQQRPADVVYIAEESSDAMTWTEVARREGLAPWAGGGADRIMEHLSGEGYFAVTLRAPGGWPSRFSRVLLMLQDGLASN